jgi:hypothetical protein
VSRRLWALGAALAIVLVVALPGAAQAQAAAGSSDTIERVIVSSFNLGAYPPSEGWVCTFSSTSGRNVNYECVRDVAAYNAQQAALAVTAAQCRRIEEWELRRECMELAAANYVPHTYLPAWRWRQVTDLNMAPGWFSGAVMIPRNALAEMLFTFAGFIWSALLFVLRFGTSLDVLSGGAGQLVNNGFVTLSEAMQGSGVWVIVILLAMFTAGRLALQGQVAKVLALTLRVVLPIGLLFAMTTISVGGGRVDSKSGLEVGSPGWIGVTGVRMVDQVGNVVSVSMTSLSQRVGRTEEPAKTACDAYRIQLVGLETAQSRADGSSSAMALVSKLWESSFLNSWMSAQYGSVAAGTHMYCFDLEARLSTAPAEQAEVLRDATDGRLSFAAAAFQDTAPDSVKDRAKIFMFAACQPDATTGEVTAQEGWTLLGGPTQDECAAWVGSGNPKGLNWKDATSINAARSDHIQNRDVTFAYNTVRATWGHNGAQRVTEGIVAIITAGVYLYALGGVAVGAIMAQYGLFLMLLLLPVTLVMLALPSSSGGRNPTGVRMLKITGGFFFAKMALTLVMSLLVVASTLLGSLIPARAGGMLGAGSMLSLAHAFVPLVSLFLVRKLLTTLGLGDITKLSGAVGLLRRPQQQRPATTTSAGACAAAWRAAA